MLVAIIDDGILSDLFNNGKLKYDMTITKNGYVKRRKPSETITTTHGTTIAGIIKKYAPTATFCSIRVLHEAKNGKLTSSPLQLYHAMRWCLKKRIPIIHLSLGTVTPSDFEMITSITNRLLRNGRTIVAAAHNNGMYTIPAQLPGVLGVKVNTELAGADYRENPDADGVKYLASSIHELTLPDGTIFTTPPSNSYAAPTITAAVMNGKLTVS